MTFLIFDPTLNESYNLMILEKYFVKNQSLFKGTKDEDLENIAPWIFQIENNFSQVINNESGLTLAGTLFIESEQSFESIAAHFKKFIYQTINGREYYFRFWDSRVLKKFLPTCNEMQLKDFFGPVSVFGMDSDSPEWMVEFLFESGRLVTRKIAKEEFRNQLFSMNKEPVISAEIKPEVDDKNNDKPKRKWNFLID